MMFGASISIAHRYWRIGTTPSTKTERCFVMATARKVAEKKVAGVLNLAPIERVYVTCTLKGLSTLVQHKWGEKALQMIRDKQQKGKKTRDRDLRNPEKEAADAAYRTVDGKLGVNILAVKKSILMAAHKDLGIERVLAAKAIFIVCDDPNFVIPFDDPKIQYKVHEDAVRVGQGTADLRYRPYYYEWSVTVTFQLDVALLQTKDFLTLVNWAGSRLGIGEMRPEKHGEFGRFQIDLDKGVTEKKVA